MCNVGPKFVEEVWRHLRLQIVIKRSEGRQCLFVQPKSHVRRRAIPATTMSNSEDRKPVADQAEADAWFPSPFSLTQYVLPKTDFDGADYPNAYKGGKWRILLIATQERYLKMDGGEFFSTGNHPVEMLLPLLHLDSAGFEIDIATISGDPVKFEMWAMPKVRSTIKSSVLPQH